MQTPLRHVVRQQSVEAALVFFRNCSTALGRSW
jgi:hypothetical protein